MSSPEDKIRYNLALYAQSLDAHDVEGLVSSFDENAVIHGGSGDIVGRDAIRKWIEGYYAGQVAGRGEKHMFANPMITVDGDTAEARTDVVVFRCLDDAPWRSEAVTKHHDTLKAQADGTWRFTEKRIERIGVFTRQR